MLNDIKYKQYYTHEQIQQLAKVQCLHTFGCVLVCDQNVACCNTVDGRVHCKSRGVLLLNILGRILRVISML